MLFIVMEWIAYLYYWTWFLWPFLFVFSLAHGIRELIEDEKKGSGNLALAAFSLLVMLAGLLFPIMQ